MKKLILILALISTVAYAGIDYIIQNKDQDKDIIVRVNDGGTSTEVMRIDGSSSNVGINETTPANKLHVSETATNSYIARFESNQASNAGIMLRDSSAAADAKNKFIRSSGGELHFGEDVDAENSKTVQMSVDSSGFLNVDSTITGVGSQIRNDGDIKLANTNASQGVRAARVIGAGVFMADDEDKQLPAYGAGTIVFIYRSGSSLSTSHWAMVMIPGANSILAIQNGGGTTVSDTANVDGNLNIYKVASGQIGIRNRVGNTASYGVIAFSEGSGINQ